MTAPLILCTLLLGFAGQVLVGFLLDMPAGSTVSKSAVENARGAMATAGCAADNSLMAEKNVADLVFEVRRNVGTAMSARVPPDVAPSASVHWLIRTSPSAVHTHTRVVSYACKLQSLPRNLLRGNYPCDF